MSSYPVVLLALAMCLAIPSCTPPSEPSDVGMSEEDKQCRDVLPDGPFQLVANIDEGKTLSGQIFWNPSKRILTHNLAATAPQNRRLISAGSLPVKEMAADMSIFDAEGKPVAVEGDDLRGGFGYSVIIPRLVSTKSELNAGYAPSSFEYFKFTLKSSDFPSKIVVTSVKTDPSIPTVRYTLIFAPGPRLISMKREGLDEGK